MNDSLGLTAPMNPTETIREINQNPVESTEIPSSTSTNVEVENIDVITSQNSSPNTQNPQVISAIKNGAVEKKTTFYNNPNELSSILDEKSGGNYGVDIRKISKN